MKFAVLAALVAVTNATGAPSSAKADLAADAQAKAAQELTAFHTLEETTAKTNDKYSAMTADKKKEWDAAWAKKVTARKASDTKDKTNAGYDKMTAEAKTVYDAELLKWKKAVFETCKTSPNTIECKDARGLRDDSEKARIASKYYTQGVEQRKKLDTSRADAEKKAKATLSAAWLKANPAKTGEPGFSCLPPAPKTACGDGAFNCCGAMWPKGNAAGDTTTG